MDMKTLLEMLQSLYCAANEMGPGSNAYDFLLARIDTVNGQIAELANQQSYQDGQNRMESAKAWNNKAA